MGEIEWYDKYGLAQKLGLICLIVSIILNIFFCSQWRKASTVLNITEATLQDQQIRLQEFITRDSGDASEELIFIYISGAVNTPGVYQYSCPVRLFEVLEDAGGTTAEADIGEINLVAKLIDGSKVYIPKQGEVIKSYNGQTVSLAESQFININTASTQQLQTLNGIGAVKAADIIAYREAHGLFKKKEDIMNVKGIGSSIYDKIEAMIIVN